MRKTPITVAYGDGIGPEIMEAVIKILRDAEANITIDTIEVGKKYYDKGYSTGIPNDAWDSIRNTGILLKAPITTPQGGGYKSLNVTLRKALGLYANVRPCISLHPYIRTNYPDLDMVIIRENEEDLYSGVEYRQTENLYHCIKIVSKQGCQRIIEYAFKFAERTNRKKVSCFTKDNIMKMTDGLFHKIFNKIAAEYPELENDHYIVDIGSARVASKPEIFDVIVTSNLYGDIISDIAAEVSGSVGTAGSANIGDKYAMFEAIHGSAPDIAGKNIANPSGLLNAAVMMLVHIDDCEKAELLHNAWLATIEQGIHTADIYDTKVSSKKVGTQEFADAVIANLGKKPENLKPVHYKPKEERPHTGNEKMPEVETFSKKELVGVDVFIDSHSEPTEVAGKMDNCSMSMDLTSIYSRGLKVWPNSDSISFPIGYWRCRFLNKHGQIVKQEDIIKLLENLLNLGMEIIKAEYLFNFDGERGFTLGQGE